MAELDERDRSRLARSGLVSTILWVFIITLMMIMPARSPRDAEIEEFPVVTLTLNRPQVSAAAEANPADERQSGISAAPEPVPAPKASPAPKTVAAPKASPTKKPAASTSPAKARAAPIAPAKPVPGDLGIPDFDTPSTRQAKADGRDEELVFTGSSAESVVPKPKTARQVVPEFEGKAAVVERETAVRPAVSSRGSATVASSASDAVSTDTERSLSSISTPVGGTPSDSPSSDGSGTAGSGTRAGESSSAGARDATGSSSVGAITFEGTSRRLLYPAKPSIVLPERLSRLIDSNRTVTVSMTVAADGTVPASMISFSPAALLPPEVRDYLGSELSKWRFDQGKGNGQARFLYSIRVQ